MFYSDAFEGGSCLRMVTGGQGGWTTAAPLFEIEDNSRDPFIVELTVKEHDATLKLHLQFDRGQEQLMLSRDHVRLNFDTLASFGRM